MRFVFFSLKFIFFVFFEGFFGKHEKKGRNIVYKRIHFTFCRHSGYHAGEQYYCEMLCVTFNAIIFHEIIKILCEQAFKNTADAQQPEHNRENMIIPNLQDVFNISFDYNSGVLKKKLCLFSSFIFCFFFLGRFEFLWDCGEQNDQKLSSIFHRWMVLHSRIYRQN